MKIMLPGFQGMDDGEEFSVIDIIFLFSWGEQLRKVGARMPIAV